MKTLYHGSCHCGAVAYAASLDLAEGIRRCNCSFCLKLGYRKSFTGGGDVEVLEGQDLIADYQAPHSAWPPGNIHHYHCPRCGTHVFSRGFLDLMGGWFHAVNVSTLDDAPEADLAAAPVIYEDGRNDRQMQAPQITAYL
ncbi:MAG TPA: GFA family protein [Devosiaceae bacterium]|jgi:hypothetical protein